MSKFSEDRVYTPQHPTSLDRFSENNAFCHTPSMEFRFFFFCCCNWSGQGCPWLWGVVQKKHKSYCLLENSKSLIKIKWARLFTFIFYWKQKKIYRCKKCWKIVVNFAPPYPAQTAPTFFLYSVCGCRRRRQTICLRVSVGDDGVNEPGFAMSSYPKRVQPTMKQVGKADILVKVRTKINYFSPYQKKIIFPSY